MKESQSMGGGLTVLLAAALAGALALPLVIVLSIVISSFSITFAIYFLVFCLIGELMLSLSSGIVIRLSRGDAANDLSQLEEVPQESVRVASTAEPEVGTAAVPAVVAAVPASAPPALARTSQAAHSSG